MKVIKTWVWNPNNSLFKAKKTDTAIGHICQCDNRESCEILKENKCTLLSNNGLCPYGKRTREQGYTFRSKKFSSWINDFRIKYHDTIDVKLDSPKKLSYIGDYVFLPYSFLGLNKNINFYYSSGFLSNNPLFINKKDFTIDFIYEEIITFVPMALMGGVIKDYSEKEVPSFVFHLKELDKDLFNQLIEKYNDVNKIVEEHTNVGRKALLSSIIPNVSTVEFNGKSWKWDGEYLYRDSSDGYSFILNGKFDKIIIHPTEDCDVKITDDLQVNENTKFID